MQAGETDVKAIKFSPGFGTDKAILVVTENVTVTGGCFQIFRLETGDTDWNGSVGYLTAADWKKGIFLTPGSAVVGLLTADIAAGSPYIASDDDERLAYIALAGATSGGGVVRLNDTVQTDLQTWSGNNLAGMSSVALNDEGTLVTGEFLDSKVYQFLTPTATTPKATKVNTLKQPGGTNNTRVAYSGSNVVATTSGDEGCFSISTDDGYSFNDIAIINTLIAGISDYSVSADGSIYYLSTASTAGADNDTSLWIKKDSIFKRVMSLKNQTQSTSLLVRVAPDNKDVVYVGQLGTQNMWMSKNGGLESWKAVPIYALGAGDTIVDFAVVSADLVYVVDNDGITKTANGGASWSEQETPTGGVIPYMITVAPNGDVLVGDTNGYVAYSKDAGATYTMTKDFGTGNAIVVPDDGYATNNIIYVGIGTSVKRGKADDTTTPATRGAVTSTHTITGVAQASGVVYVLSCNTTGTARSTMWQSLKLETAADTASPYTDADWSNTGDISDTVTPGANANPVYNAGRNTLRSSMSGTTPKLWAIDTVSADDVESFTDPVSLAAPVISAPADKASIPINTLNGDAYDITYTFKRYASSKITSAILEIATDSSFNAIIKTDTMAAGTITADTVARVWGPSTGVNYMPGQTYYWRVRTTTPINSPWTAARSFTMASLDAPFATAGPAAGAADVSIRPSFTWSKYAGAIKYVIEVSEYPDFKILDWSANVDYPFYATSADEEFKYSTTYYWRVKGVITESPYVVGPWVTSVFTTEAKPVEETGTDEPQIITVPGETQIVTVEVPTTQPIPAYLLWVIVGVGAILVIALIVLIVRTRRVA
jgi:hypothetical protein